MIPELIGDASTWLVIPAAADNAPELGDELLGVVPVGNLLAAAAAALLYPP
jgi:hypothetical protein